MKHVLQTMRKDEQGFTLVELAVVMIIIGILIGGILKGQELITNARITSTISQFESLSAAYNDFRNQYNATPGDMIDADTRLANCGAAACVRGDGDGQLDDLIGAAPAGEALNFYLHLLGAGYLTGLDGNGTGFGHNAPAAPVGGGYGAGRKVGAAANGFPDGRAGVYISLLGAQDAVAAGNGIVTTTQAQRIDTKLDDGSSDTGSMLGDTANTGCDTYDGAEVTSVCSLAYKIN